MTNQQRIKQIANLHKAMDKTMSVHEVWVVFLHMCPLDYTSEVAIWKSEKWVKKDKNNEPDIMSVEIDIDGKLVSADERLTEDQINEAVEYGREWLGRE